MAGRAPKSYELGPQAEQDNTASRVRKVFPFPCEIRTLKPSDLPSCVAVENAAFTNPEHRASPEKIDYRLTKCTDICRGIFCTMTAEDAGSWGLHVPGSSRPDGTVSVLLAHILATKCNGIVIIDGDMAYPKDWRTRAPAPAEVGHQENGRSIAIHSLAVAPSLHGQGLGRKIMEDYVRYIQGLKAADRVSLICQDYLIPFYAKLGYANMGGSNATYGGGGWYDMVLEFSD